MPICSLRMETKPSIPMAMVMAITAMDKMAMPTPRMPLNGLILIETVMVTIQQEPRQMAVQMSMDSPHKIATVVLTVIRMDIPILMKTGQAFRERMHYHLMEHNGSMVMVTAMETMPLVTTLTSVQPRLERQLELGYQTQKIHNKTPNFLHMVVRIRMGMDGLMLLNPMEWMHSQMSISTLTEMELVRIQITTTMMLEFKPNKIIAISTLPMFEKCAKDGGHLPMFNMLQIRLLRIQRR